MSDNALNQAKAKADSIIAMVAALNVDYDRLEELRQMNEEGTIDDDEDQHSTRERIQQDALDVQVRSDWHAPGEIDTIATEFYILLCTDGPAVRIMGELDEYMQPYRAWIEYQDWGTPWTMLDSMYTSQDVLLQYCQQFYFGE